MVFGRKGFSLIEVLLVIILIALAAGFALPRVAGAVKHYQFQTDLANIEKALRYAQYQAILEERIFRINLDQANKTYAVQRQVDPEDFRAFEPVKVGARTVHVLDEGTSFLGGYRELLFFPDGTMTYPFRILLESKHGSRVEITNKGLGLFKTVWQRG